MAAANSFTTDSVRSGVEEAAVGDLRDGEAGKGKCEVDGEIDV